MDHFHLHHSAYGGIQILTKDRNLEDVSSRFEEHNVQLLLKKSTITYEKSEHQSTIDLVFASPCISESLFCCKFAKNLNYRSDLYTVIICFNLRTVSKNKKNQDTSLKNRHLKLQTIINEYITNLKKDFLNLKKKFDK